MSLYEHQTVGAAWLAARDRGYLGDVPGLGKTRTLIRAAIDTAYKPLVVCPAIVRTHWHREFDTFGRDRWAIVKSYDEIVRGGNALMKDLILNEKIDTLLLDECHYCKHASSKRAQQLLGQDGYARRMARVYAASGTPVPKNPLEFATTLLSLFPEVALDHDIRSIADFRDRYCVTRGAFVRGQWREKVLPQINHEADFKEMLSKCMLRRTLDDVGIDVPELDWQMVRLDGDVKGEQWDEAKYMMDRGWGNDIVMHFRMIRDGCFGSADLAAIADDPHIARMRRRLGELKVVPVLEMVTQQLADSDEKIVIFAHHRQVLHALHEPLLGFGAVYVDGDTSQAQRDYAIDAFQNDPARRVFIGQNIACQTGITLTAARRVILVEPDWTATVNQQLGARIARIGQRHRCVGQMIALAGTLDESIIRQNIQEVKLADAIGLGK